VLNVGESKRLHGDCRGDGGTGSGIRVIRAKVPVDYVSAGSRKILQHPSSVPNRPTKDARAVRYSDDSEKR